jgi:threonine dehydratase
MRHRYCTPMTQFTDAARAAICAPRERFPETPLQRNDHLCQLYDANIWLKRENLSPERSYRPRGPFTALRKHMVAQPVQQRLASATG